MRLPKPLWNGLKSFLFELDAERVHRLTVKSLRTLNALGFSPRNLSGAPSSKHLSERPVKTLWNLPFHSSVGLAAGFDKDGELIPLLPSFGFGFAEVGTVTPRPQEGNPKPRLFRLPEKEALFNRMGFNNAGMGEVSSRIKQYRERELIPSWFRVGLNAGKNKDTPPEKASEDYCAVVRSFEGLVDFVVINVSSPNTPGLRDLQSKEALRRIVLPVVEGVQNWKAVPPVLVKFAPELTETTLSESLLAAEEAGASGFVLTNTLQGEWPNPPLSGGWSGAPLKSKALESLSFARKITRLPVIGVGGILNPSDARERIEAGADLIEIYSGWIFQGPAFPEQLRRALDGQNF